jgi:hypothetical protein
MKRCATCGQENDDWRPFCTRCGASYAGPAAEPVLVPPPAGAPPRPPTPGSELPGTRHPGQHRPAPRVVGIAAVLAVVVAVGAFVGLSTLGGSNKGRAAPTTTFPAVWDSRVSDLVRFDTSERNLDFKHPVEVVFLSKAAFKKRVTTSDSKLSAKDRRDLQTGLETLRAMGMVDGKVDLFKKLNQLSGETTLAFYDDKKQQIVIPGSTIDVAEKVTIAHELTHTLDDQHFDLAKVNKIGDKHDTDAVTALIEGDARWVENQYVAKLSESDRTAYQRSQESDSKGVDLSGVPAIFGLLQQWPYDFGDQFVAILHKEGGQPRVNEAFRSPPIAQEQVIDPIAFLEGDKPGAISVPKLPTGAKKLDGGKEFGALMWYLVLSERIDAHVALKAALGWGADAYTEAREAGHTCIEVHYRGETRRDNTEMLTALHQWIAALPKGMATVKANPDDTLSLRSCDPGVNAKVVTDRSGGAYQLLLFRDQLIEEFGKAGATVTVATCLADAVTDRATVAGIAAGKAPAVLSDQAAFGALVNVCRSTPSTNSPPDQIDK